MGAVDLPLGVNFAADVFAGYRFGRPVHRHRGPRSSRMAASFSPAASPGSLSQREFLGMGPTRPAARAPGQRAGRGARLPRRSRLIHAVRCSQPVTAANFGAPPLELQRFRGRRLYRDRSFGDRTGTAFVQIKDPAELIGLDMQGDRLIVAGYTRSELSPDDPLTLLPPQRPPGRRRPDHHDPRTPPAPLPQHADPRTDPSPRRITSPREGAHRPTPGREEPPPPHARSGRPNGTQARTARPDGHRHRRSGKPRSARSALPRLPLGLRTDEAVERRDIRLPGDVDRLLTRPRPMQSHQVARITEDPLDVLGGVRERVARV